MLGYLYDKKLHQTINSNSQNYWDIYIEEINDQLGIRANRLSLADMECPQRLKNIKTMIIGCQSAGYLTAQAKDTLNTWVLQGGILIGFGVNGLDNIFGISCQSTITQKNDDYTISGKFQWMPHRLAKDIHPLLFLEQKLLILSDIMCAQLSDGQELAHLYSKDDKDLSFPAVTWRQYGEGQAGWFAFDVAKTIWVLHQGRPTWDIIPENTNQPRTCELQIIESNFKKVFYADELLFVLQNMIAQNHHPFIYQIPPSQDGRFPDALFYWGGDEYRGPVEESIRASDWMKQKGLPYHINIESEHHPITVDQARRIIDNGHELSAYYTLDVSDGKGGYETTLMTEETFIRQNNAFFEKFGYRPICSVNHNLRWKGWVEPAKWIEKAGGKADNSFAVNELHRPNLWGNAPCFGSGFGTCYPFYFYDDYTGKNKRINVIEEPIVSYEIGHRGTVRGTAGDLETVAFEEIHLAVDLAVKHHFLMNMFYHPTHINTKPTCRQAIEELLMYILYKKACVIHMGNDEVWRWWDSRSKATMEEVKLSDNMICFECCCEYHNGMIIKLLVKDFSSINIQCDGSPASYHVRKEFAGTWLYIEISQGKHNLSVELF